MSVPIHLQELRKSFGSVAAVDGVTLDVPAGSLFFLLGPSGCGKTTLLRLLAGFLEPDAGSIRFGDQDVTHLPPNQRNTGLVFQNYALWPHLTVAQNVAFGLDVRRVPTKEKSRRVAAALERVQMEPYAKRKPNELSGGQQQRVALARALVVQPTVLLLDEPLSNLDAKLRLEMRGQIRQICREANITAVYVTHDQKEALSMADRIALMRQGQVVQVDTPRELYDRPSVRFVADFLGETNFLSAEVVGTEGDLVILECPAGRFRSSAFPDDLPRRGNVTCSIRPEAIRLLRPGEAAINGVNCFPGRLLESVYLGEEAQHQLAVHDKLILKVVELHPRGLSLDASAPTLAFEPRDVVILRD